jgi:hypothetical protein
MRKYILYIFRRYFYYIFIKLFFRIIDIVYNLFYINFLNSIIEQFKIY